MRIGIIGGTGMEQRLVSDMGERGFRAVTPETPFGPPSAPIRVGAVGDEQGERVELALLTRHGEGHTIPPHELPSRANIYALKSLGVTHIIATGACGSLRESIRPGEIVICDQLIDRTVSRPRTFFDDVAVHVEFADPFCPVMRSWLVEAARCAGLHGHDEGTMVVIEGPAFSTRAEAAMHRAMGADLVGMTALPEAKLAREAEIAYALIALPTDDDCWRQRRHTEDVDSLLQTIHANLHRATDAALRLIQAALRDVSDLRKRSSPAHEALQLAIWTQPDAIPEATRNKYAPLWGTRPSK